MAMNGREALDVLRSGSGVDLVLTDIWMPELDGVGLLKAIRADAALSSLPVFAITADVEMQKNPEGSGFTGLFLKPITLENLETILRR
jgi:two-component system chemotaxis response regulator CheY